MAPRARASGRESDPLIDAGAKSRASEGGVENASRTSAWRWVLATRGRRWTASALAMCACVVGAFVHSYYVAPHTLIRVMNTYVLGTPTREIKFRVFVCGIPEDLYAKHLPWPICRVKLVGCPGGGASCYHWRFAQGIEMPMHPENRGVFEITTSRYGTGDVFGFGAIEAGCNVADEARCQADGSHADCKSGDVCDHRYDSGTHYATEMHNSRVNTTCWKDDPTRCSSASPGWHPIRSHKPGSHHCFTVMDKWYNRVIPPRVREISYVWGTCDHEPRNPDACVNWALPNVCDLLGEPASDQPIEEPQNCKLSDGTNAPDGTTCRIMHKKPGIKSMSVEGDCCNGECCALGNVCDISDGPGNGFCRKIDEVFPTNHAICVDPWYPQTYGVCTQSCGSGNGDCDRTCMDAKAKGYEVDCDENGAGNRKCLCSNVGGHTANECQNSANPGYKCCTCKSITGQGTAKIITDGKDHGLNYGQTKKEERVPA